MAVLLKVYVFWGITVCQASIPRGLKYFFKVEQSNKNSCVGRRVHIHCTITRFILNLTCIRYYTWICWMKYNSKFMLCYRISWQGQQSYSLLL